MEKRFGPSSLPVDILKLLKSVVSKPLEFIFNASFETGIAPSNFKLANVILIFKKGSKYCISNYRPISLLPVFNKFIEKLMFNNRLIKFLKKHDIFFEKQFGFRANHSTEHAILCIIDRIQKAIENRSYSCGIFLDFSKAFDIIDHMILIKKLEYYGTRGVAKKWFISYLSNRRQIVTVNGVQSEENSITCGVPQGSVLGPLLCLIYVNDFHSCSDLFDFHMFADDANLFYESNNIASLVTTVNNELGKAYTWLCANKLLFNIDKSNFVIFHPPQRNIPNQNLYVTINGICLKREFHATYLGVQIDSHLNWKKHIEHTCKEIRSIDIICKIRHFISKNILVNLYYHLIYPFLMYGLTSWENTYESNLKPIYISQKKVLRLMSFSAFDHPSSPLFKCLKILKFSDIVTFQNAALMYKFHDNMLPHAFKTFFNKVDQVHIYNTRLAAKQSYYIPKVRTMEFLT